VTENSNGSIDTVGIDTATITTISNGYIMISPRNNNVIGTLGKRTATTASRSSRSTTTSATSTTTPKLNGD
jgi:hypothetical protein